MPEISLKDVTATIKTFLRDKSLFYCVETLRLQYPEMHIIVADDGHCSDEKEERLLAMGVDKYIRMPWNSGLSAGRNALIDACETPYALMCEDDFSFTPNSHIEHLRQLMDVVDIAAGLVYNVRRWACHQGGEGWDPFGWNFARKGGKIFRTGLTGHLKLHEGIRYETADLVLNFFVASVDALKKVRWDESLRLAFEHVDFFLRAKDAGLVAARSLDAQVIHKMIDDSHNPEYQKFRDDYEQYKAPFEKKWGFAWLTDLPGSRPSPIITVPPPAGIPQPTPPPPPPPPPTPDVSIARCNRHNVLACSVCIAHGWPFRQPNDLAPARQIVSQQATPAPAPAPANPQVQTAASKALTGNMRPNPNQGALYRNNRGTDNQRKIK